MFFNLLDGNISSSFDRTACVYFVVKVFASDDAYLQYLGALMSDTLTTKLQ